MNRIRSAFLFGSLAGALAAAAPARAQTIPSSAYGALRGRLIGPHRGGRVLAVAGIPGDPATFYFGAVDGGVWRTRNAGVTWDPLFDDQPIASIGALALASSDPNVIYVGTGEAAIRSDITYGAGVYKSNDGGAHWRAVGLADTRHIGKLLVDPRNADVVLVAALGHAYGPNPERGVFRSTDGGRTWAKVLYKNPDTGAIDLASDPDDPHVVYAALWQARRPAWSQYPPDEGPGSGLYRSSDGGATWTELTGHGLPAGPLGRIGLGYVQANGIHDCWFAALGMADLVRPYSRCRQLPSYNWAATEQLVDLVPAVIEGTVLISAWELPPWGGAEYAPLAGTQPIDVLGGGILVFRGRFEVP